MQPLFLVSASVTEIRLKEVQPELTWRRKSRGTCLPKLLFSQSRSRRPTSVETWSYSVMSSRQSPRPDTPEPGSRQGRRNAQPGVQLLDDDGAISDQVRGLPSFNIACRYRNNMYSWNHVFCTSLQNTVFHRHQIIPAHPKINGWQ
jgi:hypothetical protein